MRVFVSHLPNMSPNLTNSMVVGDRIHSEKMIKLRILGMLMSDSINEFAMMSWFHPWLRYR